MARGPKQHVLVLAASKGGVGKTTLASALAVRACADGKRVALIDVDPQASLERWWELRGEPDNPKIVGIEASQEGLGLLIAEGFEWVIIDTPPALMDHIHEAIAVADFVVIPTRASAIDIESIGPVRDMCSDLGKPFAFLLNAVDTSVKLAGGGAMVNAVAKYLKADGPVLESQVGYRPAYIKAMVVGKSGAEMKGGGVCKEEVDNLWAEIKKLTVRAIGKKARANV